MANNDSISLVFRQPFAEQVAFFRGKLGNLAPTAKWDDLWKSQHDRAFMVAGAAKADLLADLAAAVDKAIAEGETLQDFRARFHEIIQRHGWAGFTGDDRKTPDGKGGKGLAWRTRIIYQTNLSTSYAAGRLAQLKDAGFQLWVYRHSGSEHPRLQHLAWNGLTLPANHPFWQTHYPPSGWNCFPGETDVRADALLGQRFFYTGEMVELETRLGHRLALTINHPVLTRRGWVPAGELQAGDEVLAAALNVNTALHGIVNDPQSPTRAEDLFESLATQGLRVVPMTADDFYGDAAFGEGEVDIAGADRVLVNVLQSKSGEGIGEGGLQPALAGGVESADAALCAAQDALVITETAPTQNILHGRLGDAKPLRNLARADQPVAVEADNLALQIGVARVGGFPGTAQDALAPIGSLFFSDPTGAHAARSVANIYAARDQQSPQGIAAGAALFGQLLEANAGKVARDEVVGVRKFDWSGHVYDFTTATGLIMAGGIVVSNCRCRVVGATGSKTAELLGGKPGYTEPPAGWDVRDAKGLLPGVDKGWDYQPGATVADAVRALASKTVAWPYELAKAYMGGVPENVRDALALAVRSQPETGEAVRRYAQAALAGRSVDPYRTMGLLTTAEAETIAAMTGVEAIRREMYDWAIAADEVRHVERRHGADGIDAGMGQLPVSVTDYALLPRAILDGRLEAAGTTGNGSPAVSLHYQTDEARYLFVFEIRKGRRMVSLKSARKWPAPAPHVRNASGYEPDGAMLRP